MSARSIFRWSRSARTSSAMARCDTRPGRKVCSTRHARDCRAQQRAALAAGAGADQPGWDPIHFLCGRKPVHKHSRLAFPLVEIGNLDVTVFKAWHGLYLALSGQGSNILPIALRMRRSRRRRKIRNAVRSTTPLSAHIKPNTANSAPKSQTTSKASAASMIALRPANLRMARVRLPSFSASLATRVMSLGLLGNLQGVQRRAARRRPFRRDRRRGPDAVSRLSVRLLPFRAQRALRPGNWFAGPCGRGPR